MDSRLSSKGTHLIKDVTICNFKYIAFIIFNVNQNKFYLPTSLISIKSARGHEVSGPSVILKTVFCEYTVMIQWLCPYQVPLGLTF